MFGFLKEKLKGALQRFTKGVDEKAKTEEVKEVVEKKAKPAKQKPVQKQKKISSNWVLINLQLNADLLQLNMPKLWIRI